MQDAVHDPESAVLLWRAYGVSACWATVAGDATLERSASSPARTAPELVGPSRPRWNSIGRAGPLGLIAADAADDVDAEVARSRFAQSRREDRFAAHRAGQAGPGGGRGLEIGDRGLGAWALGILPRGGDVLAESVRRRRA